MRYRKFGRLSWESSALGLGVMDLPRKVGGDPAAVDETAACRIIRSAIDHGLNYVDLGFPTETKDHGPAVRAARKALEDGYRQKVRLALTVPASLISSPEDFDRRLEQQLSWLGADGVDLCLLGRLTRENWPVLQSMGVLDALERAQADGRIGHAGFSFHDHYQPLRTVIQDYDRWAVCSVEYSFMDVNHDPGANGIRYAAEQGLAVVATRPFKGGRLVKDPPLEVQQVWARSTRDWSRAEWALRFVLNHPGVSVAVCDIGSLEQLAEDLDVAESAEADGLSIADEVTVSNVRDAFRKRQPIPCPSCRPCMPCPLGIDVPRFFEICNEAAMYDDVAAGRALCADERIRPQDCTGCGICESRCAKGLGIVERLSEGRRFLRLDSEEG